MTQLSHPDMTLAYLHQQDQQLSLRAKRHYAVHDDRPPKIGRTTPARRPRRLLAKFAAAARHLRFGWFSGSRSQTPRPYKAST
jgi:hypothetical protein